MWVHVLIYFSKLLFNLCGSQFTESTVRLHLTDYPVNAVQRRAGRLKPREGHIILKDWLDDRTCVLLSESYEIRSYIL